MVWLHHEKAVHLHHKGVHTRGCTCLKCTNKAKKCTNQARVHQAKNSTNSSVGAAETAAPPKVHQPSREHPNNNK